MQNGNHLTGKILLLLIGVIVLMMLLYGKKDKREELPDNQPEDLTVQEAEPKPERPVTDYDLKTGSTIRVVLKTTDYKNIFHENVILTSDSDVSVRAGALRKTIPAGAELSLNSLLSAYEELTGGETEVPNQAVFQAAEDGTIKILTIGRKQGTPAYRGSLEIRKTDRGYVIINELPIEEYLYSVVTSEMPSDYPAEALKAQAVCARSYAVRQMQDAAYKEYGADVDDSSGYQVYNNVKESENAVKAVQDTHGRVVLYQGELACTYYFSTSCGLTTNDEVWRDENGIVSEQKPYLTEKAIAADTGAEEGSVSETDAAAETDVTTEEGFSAYIQSVNEQDYEKEEPWYRWNMSFYPSQLTKLKDRLAERFKINPHLILTQSQEGFASELPKELEDLTDIQVLHRNAGGLIDEVLLTFGEEEIKVLTEYNIRYVLAAQGAVITKQDGSIVPCDELLPSAYFTMELKRAESNGILEEIVLSGGGFGHGAGMSQNGAKHMALLNMDYMDILTFFYEGTTIGAIYD